MSYMKDFYHVVAVSSEKEHLEEIGEKEGVSTFVVEMTRKNVSAGLIESFSDECEECNGRGLIIGDIFSNNSVDTDLLESEAVVE